MKIQFEKREILKIFAFYLIIIAVPLTVLMIQGNTSLESKREQMLNDIYDGADEIINRVIRDLREEWLIKMEREKVRPYNEYQPVIIIDSELFAQTGEGIDRSPLYEESVRNIENLHYKGTTDLSGARSSPPSLEQILARSRAGFFEYNPATGTMSSPYENIQGFDSLVSAELVRSYSIFLERELKPMLISELAPIGERLDAMDTLIYLKVKRVRIYKEPRRRALTDEEAFADLGSAIEVIQAGLYDFKSLRLNHRGQELVCIYRPVLISSDSEGQQLLIQGFLVNNVRLIQEAQAYLEPLQPDFGNLVAYQMEGTLEAGSVPLDAPFDNLALRFTPTDETGYLSSVEEEKKRFWAVIALLVFALLVSGVHMGRLIYAHMDLYRKKNNFVSAVTHELKTPLTSIIMYAEMLEEGWAKGKEEKYYHYIHWESERLTRLIKNILDFSGLERGSFKFNPEPMVLHEFVAKALEPLSIWTENSGLTVNIDVKAEPEVMVDTDSLAQVIYNLCDNTIKYGMSHETPTLTIEVNHEGAQGVLRVYDNGSGIPKKDEGKVFERFYRVESEMTRERTGTGLGLALVKELVEGNRGKINLYRPDTGGFGVKIVLPPAHDGELAA